MAPWMAKQILWKHICWNIICCQSIEAESQCTGAELSSQKNAIFETTQQDFRKLFVDLPSKFFGNVFPLNHYLLSKYWGWMSMYWSCTMFTNECNIWHETTRFELVWDLPSKFSGNIFPFELLSVVKVLGLNVNVLDLNYVHQECNIWRKKLNKMLVIWGFVKQIIWKHIPLLELLLSVVKVLGKSQYLVAFNVLSSLWCPP